jgi:hypothetical protein
MKVLSRQEAMAWCQAHGVALDDWGLPKTSDAESRFEIPNDAQKRVYLVSQAMKAFNGAPVVLVWFHDWSVWPSGQRMHVFDRFRRSYGEARLLIDSPGHLFEGNEIEDAISFVTVAVLFLWDCHVVTASRSKQLYFSHDEFGLAKGVELECGRKLPAAAPGQIRARALPVWWTDLRDPPAGDPIGCPVTVDEMVAYINPLLPFEVLPRNLEFIKKGQVDASAYWLWAFYGNDARRWNLCVFSGGPMMRTWMCADNNPHELDDHDYVAAIHNQEY